MSPVCLSHSGKYEHPKHLPRISDLYKANKDPKPQTQNPKPPSKAPEHYLELCPILLTGFFTARTQKAAMDFVILPRAGLSLVDAERLFSEGTPFVY